VNVHALVVSLRSYIREVLDLEPIPASVVIPDQGPARPQSSGGGRSGSGGEAARGRGAGSGTGGAGMGGGMMMGGGMAGLGAGMGSTAGEEEADPVGRR